MAYCGHCAADGMSAACPPGDRGDAGGGPGLLPAAWAGCELQIEPLWTLLGAVDHLG